MAAVTGLTQRVLGALRTDSAFWRRALLAGVHHGPDPWLRYSPPLFGVAFGAALGAPREVVRGWIRKIKGPQPPFAELRDVAEVFANFASSMSEALLVASGRGYHATNRPVDDWYMFSSFARRRGIIVATAQTAGWDIGGHMLNHIQSQDVLVVMEREQNDVARALSDRHRLQGGIRLLHVDDGPLASLELLRHLKQRRGVVALKFDRVVPGMRTRTVRFLDGPWEIPEGPLLLSSLTGAPILPALTRRLGFMEYQTINYPPIFVSRRPSQDELQSAAQCLANALEHFVRAHPTHWFRFHA